MQKESHDVWDTSVNGIKSLILSKVGYAKPRYPSDVAIDYSLDYDAGWKPWTRCAEKYWLWDDAHVIMDAQVLRRVMMMHHTLQWFLEHETGASWLVRAQDCH